ncbi:resolvase [Enterococcus pernyi]
MAEAIGDPLLDKYIKDLVIQILALIAEQERKESKRRQVIAKANGVYKGRPKLYSADAKGPRRRLVYKSIVEDLYQGIVISKIAKKYNVTKQTIYRIKKELI